VAAHSAFRILNHRFIRQSDCRRLHQHGVFKALKNLKKAPATALSYLVNQALLFSAKTFHQLYVVQGIGHREHRIELAAAVAETELGRAAECHRHYRGVRRPRDRLSATDLVVPETVLRRGLCGTGHTRAQGGVQDPRVRRGAGCGWRKGKPTQSPAAFSRWHTATFGWAGTRRRGQICIG